MYIIYSNSIKIILSWEKWFQGSFGWMCCLFKLLHMQVVEFWRFDITWKMKLLRDNIKPVVAVSLAT